MLRAARQNAFGRGLPAMLAFSLPILLVAASLATLVAFTGPSLEGTAQEGWSLSSLLGDVYVMRAIRFTLFQASLSAILSTLLAIPLARALATRSFPGRSALLSLFGAPFILPIIVAILGLLAIWGKNGPAHMIFDRVGVDGYSIYGLTGILLAHIFFNLPLAARILLQGWNAIPPEQWRLAAQLGMNSRTIARRIEWPMLKERLPGALVLVFLLCVSSFTVILALGGGPRSTTIELAIYQAIRLEFDLDQAALLASDQILLCAGLALLSRLITKDHELGRSLGGQIFRTDRNGKTAVFFDAAILSLVLMFLALPLLAAFARGLEGLLTHGIDAELVFFATARSIGVALGACIVMIAISLPLAQLAIHLKGRARRLVELPGFAIMVAPPIALGAGLFLLLHKHFAVDDLALPLTALLNGMQAVPFALILLTPAMGQIKRDYGRQIAQLGMKRATALRLIHWPLMRKPVGLTFGITAALSMGDLGVIALFGSPSEPTLPLYLYQQMGAYRMDQAYGTGLLLTLFAFGFFILFDRGMGGRDQT